MCVSLSGRFYFAPLHQLYRQICGDQSFPAGLCRLLARRPKAPAKAAIHRRSQFLLDEMAPQSRVSVSAKIRNLTDFHQRLTLNQQPPSGLEIVNTLRYFQQTLLGFVRLFIPLHLLAYDCLGFSKTYRIYRRRVFDSFPRMSIAQRFIRVSSFVSSNDHSS